MLNSPTVAPAPADPVLRLARVTRRFRSGPNEVVALRDVSLTVATGEVVAVMGPSGSGKSTLVQVASGLVTCDQGRVEVDGEPVTADPKQRARLRRRDIGVVFQRLNLIPELTALENVMAPLLLDRARVGEARRAALEAMAELGIEGLTEKRPGDLSGGHEQKVAIARAIVGDRRIVVADEPTGALDSVASDEVIRLLTSRASTGTAILIVTHDASVASWADRIIWLRDGAIVDPADGQRSSRGGLGAIR